MSPRARIARQDQRPIHSQNLPNAGILALTFVEANDYTRVEQGDILMVREIRATVERANDLEVEIRAKGRLHAHHDLPLLQLEIMPACGLINWVRAKRHPARRQSGRLMSSVML